MTKEAESPPFSIGDHGFWLVVLYSISFLILRGYQMFSILLKLVLWYVSIPSSISLVVVYISEL